VLDVSPVYLGVVSVRSDPFYDIHRDKSIPLHGQAPSCTPICKNIYLKSVKGLKIFAYAAFIFKK